MNKDFIRMKQIVNGVKKSMDEVAAGKAKTYTFNQLMEVLSNKKMARIFKGKLPI